MRKSISGFDIIVLLITVAGNNLFASEPQNTAEKSTITATKSAGTSPTSVQDAGVQEKYEEVRAFSPDNSSDDAEPLSMDLSLISAMKPVGTGSISVQVGTGSISVQEKYEKAVAFYRNKRYDDAKPLLIDLSKESPKQKVLLTSPDSEDSVFPVAPAALDLLGKIYRSEKNIPAAMECYKKMESFSSEVFRGPYGGEALYGGPAEAMALIYQLEVLTGEHLVSEPPPNEATALISQLKELTGAPHVSEPYPDNETAIKLSKLLVKKYDGMRMTCWEDCLMYEEDGVGFLIRSLTNLNAPLKRWKKEFKEITDSTKNQPLSVSLLITYAEQSVKAANLSEAIDSYEQIISTYPVVYRTDDYQNTLYVYSLDALGALIDIYKKNGDQEKENSARKRYKAIYNKIPPILLRNHHTDVAVESFYADPEKIRHW